MNTKDNFRSILCLFLSLMTISAFLLSTAAIGHAQKKTREKNLRKVNASRPKGWCDPMKQEQPDLSGTYTGKVDSPDAGLTGDATLTITGNNFTITAGSSTQSGRLTAVTTCGYTGVTMMFGDLTPPTPSPNPPPELPAFSLRARKRGSGISLMSVTGEKRRFTFQCDCRKCTSDCDCCAGL